jgi:hypothetical protein
MIRTKAYPQFVSPKNDWTSIDVDIEYIEEY